MLALRGEQERTAADGPLAIWRRWATDVRGHALACGHFLPEEAPEALAATLVDFLKGDAV